VQEAGGVVRELDDEQADVLQTGHILAAATRIADPVHGLLKG